MAPATWAPRGPAARVDGECCVPRWCACAPSSTPASATTTARRPRTWRTALAAYRQPGRQPPRDARRCSSTRACSCPVVAVLGEVEVDDAGLAHDKSSDKAARSVCEGRPLERHARVGRWTTCAPSPTPVSPATTASASPDVDGRARGVRREPGGSRAGRRSQVAPARPPARAGGRGPRRGGARRARGWRTTRPPTWPPCCMTSPRRAARPAGLHLLRAMAPVGPGRPPGPGGGAADAPRRRVQDGADALVVDVAGPVPFAVEGESLTQPGRRASC